MSILSAIIAFIAAYLVGSISFAVVVTKLMGIQDPRTYGSGNPGATNVLRSGNKKAALFTLVFDALKGYVPTFLALWFSPWLGWNNLVPPAIALAAFIGHLFPIYFGFKGGKGVATAAGILFAISPWLGLGVLATWLLVAAITRYSSLAALIAAVVAPLYYAILFRQALSMPMLFAILLMSLLLIWRHKANIQKLLSGTESKIGKKKHAETEKSQQ